MKLVRCPTISRAACRKPVKRKVEGAAVSFRSEFERDYPDFCWNNKLRKSIDVRRKTMLFTTIFAHFVDNISATLVGVMHPDNADDPLHNGHNDTPG